MKKIKKLIASTMLVLVGLIAGCGANATTNNTVHADNSINYKEEELGRIKLITYVDESNGNVVYISYDMDYAGGHQLQSLGMTSQPLTKVK